jgi:hypothetical protein
MNTRLQFTTAIVCVLLWSWGVCGAAEKSSVQSGPKESPATLSIEITDQPRRMLDAWDLLGGVEVSMSSVNENYIGFHDLKHSKFNTLYGAPKIGPSRYFRKQSLVSSWTFQHGDGWLIGDMNFVLTRNKLDQDEFGPATLHMTLSGSSGPQSWTNEGTTKLEFKVRPVSSGKGYLPGTNWAYELHLVFPETLHVSNEGAVLEDLYCDTPNVSLLGSRPLYLGADTINSLVTGGFPPAFGPYNVWSAEKLVFQSNQVRDVVGTLNYTLEMSEEDKLSDVQARVDEDQRKAKLDDVPWKTARDVSFGGEKVEDRPIGLISEQWLYYWHSDFETYGDFYEEHGRVRFNVPEALRIPGAVYRGRVLEYFYADTADHPVITAVHEAVLKEGQWQSAAIVGAKATEDGFTILQAFSAMAEIAQPHSTIALPSADPASDTCPNEYQTARPVIAKQDVLAPGYGTRSVLTGSLSLQQINLTDAQNSLSRLNYYFPGATAKWSVLPGATAQVRLWLWTDDGSALGKWHLVGITENLAPYYGSTTSYLFAEALTPGRATVRITLTIGGQEIRDDLEIKCELPELAVDADRDGTIKLSTEDSTDTTSSEKPYRFWINDDDDTTNGSPLWSDLDPEFYPPRRADSADRVITSARDCEDLTRIWMNLSGLTDSIKNASGDLYVGLKWKNVGVTRPAIRLFRSADSTGGLGHIKDATIARLQANNVDSRRFDFCIVHADYANLTLDPIESNPDIDQIATVPGDRVVDLVLPKSVFADLSESQPVAHLLFEGVQEGKGELALVVLRKKSDGTWEKVFDGGSVWLQLDNIRRMYQRVHSTPLPAQFPLPYEQGFFPTFPYDRNENGALIIPEANLGYDTGDSMEGVGDFPFETSPGEQAKCVVSVHGIDVTVPEEQGYSRSFFKRLWWEGYRGRFVTFRWCTTLDAGMFRPGQPNISIFNSGEYRSWKGGTSLKNFVTSLRSQLPSKAVISVTAHSLGNACTGEALRQRMQVDSYVAMEAAVSLSAYYPEPASPASDPNPPLFDNDLVDADVAHPTPRYASQLGYHGWLSAIHANSGAKLVAYQNWNDFWLRTGETSFNLLWVDWVHNQINHKPDDRLFFGQYDYDLVNGVRRPGFTSGLTIARWVDDPHESMGYVSRSRTQALGAGSSNGSVTPPGFQSSLNLQTYGFALPRYDHSGQFQRNIQLMYADENGNPWKDSENVPLEPFYRRLMSDLNIAP